MTTIKFKQIEMSSKTEGLGLTEDGEPVYLLLKFSADGNNQLIVRPLQITDLRPKPAPSPTMFDVLT